MPASWLVAGEAAPARCGCRRLPNPRRPGAWTLREFKLDGGRVRFADAALPAGPVELNGLRVQAQGLAWPLAPGAAPLATQLSANLTLPGVRAGSAAATTAPARLARPRGAAAAWAPKGSCCWSGLPVHVFEPYFGATLPVSLQRLEAGFKGQVDLRQLPAGLSGQLRGDALLADLRVVARATAAGGPPQASVAGRELLTWNAVSLGDFGADAAARQQAAAGDRRAARQRLLLAPGDHRGGALQPADRGAAGSAAAPSRRSAAQAASAAPAARSASAAPISCTRGHAEQAADRPGGEFDPVRRMAAWTSTTASSGPTTAPS